SGAAVRLVAAGAPLEAALAEHLAGAAYLRADHPQRGREAHQRALAGYQRCGATWLSTVLSREPRAKRSTVDPGLTTREAEIAELVMAGLSNQQIASRLYLSRRTVESHLSRVFTKLGVRSRTAMTSRLSRPAHQTEDTGGDDRPDEARGAQPEHADAGEDSLARPVPIRRRSKG
ncbi:MAG TPA: LuxR C-terminal-related transcriptional regulator, partial [Rugosimonospora sp.]|nr:LuxR C-terminal-related transcriptional regulator [Rugosimonospora sp.]